jgi:DNA-directed RNA polymerase subunit RPC12/RpoP
MAATTEYQCRRCGAFVEFPPPDPGDDRRKVFCPQCRCPNLILHYYDRNRFSDVLNRVALLEAQVAELQGIVAAMVDDVAYSPKN